MSEPKRPKVGLAVLIIKDGKVLLGERIGSHGANTWCFPGGHLEWFEHFETCAHRETMEEAGVSIKNLEFIMATNDIMEDDDRHYITIFMRADHVAGEPRICEIEKCKSWSWFDWDDLPEPLFLPIQNLLSSGYNPFKTK